MKKQIVNNLRNLEKIQLDKIKTDLMAWNEMILKDTPYPKTGLADGRPRGLQELGELFDLTKERVRQIEIAALKKLKHSPRVNSLAEFLD